MNRTKIKHKEEQKNYTKHYVAQCLGASEQKTNKRKLVKLKISQNKLTISQNKLTFSQNKLKMSQTKLKMSQKKLTIRQKKLTNMSN